MQQKLFGEPTGADPNGTTDTGLEGCEPTEKVRQKQDRLFKPKPTKDREMSLIESGYLLGSTTVFLSESKYFFVGDIQHCGHKAIEHNATKMKEEMVRHGWAYGHMNYNDPPTFEKKFNRTAFDKDNELYGHDIYTWVDNLPALFDVFGIAPVGEDYYDEKKDREFYEKLYTQIKNFKEDDNEI